MILVVGGAGYIGSHINKELNKKGYKTIVYDNLSYGHREAVKQGQFILGDTGDREHLRLVFKNYKIDAVMHFAAFTSVGESVKDPSKYYTNNVANTLNLLNVMMEFGTKYFIFSSTAAVYGIPEKTPITEDHPLNPINPYGQSKLMVEKILKNYGTAYGLKSVALRYFNASGADPDNEIGEDHTPETHLIPLVLDAAIGKREDIKIFGTDYPTEDGTCIRDYIHVTDLADAHILALEYLMDGGESNMFNLGNGKGFSVREIIEKVREVTGIDFKATESQRREGDPPILMASPDKPQKILGWKQKHSDINVIIKTAWEWHKKLNNK